jgi:hypothetical protein
MHDRQATRSYRREAALEIKRAADIQTQLWYYLTQSSFIAKD